MQKWIRVHERRSSKVTLSDIGRDDNFSYHDYDLYVGLC